MGKFFFFNHDLKAQIKKAALAGYDPVPIDYILRFNKTRPYNVRERLCHAPSRNLYFSPEGHVLVCCYNTKYIIGDITKNTISEIWHGEKLNKLREYISYNDLSCGCGSCRSSLLLNNFEEPHIKFYDNFLASDGFPTSMEFQTHNTCNLECTMCSGDLSSNILSNREKRTVTKNPYENDFIQQLETFVPHLRFCLFSGGEPFLINSYFKIWEMIIQKNPSCNIIIQTNGTILNEKIKDILKRGTFHIGISIDSLNKKTYEEIRVNATYETTLKNLDFFKKYCSENSRVLSISICVMPQNRWEIPYLTEFCSQNNIHVNYNTVRFPAKNALWILNSSELQEILDYYLKFSLPTKSRIEKKNQKSFQNLITRIELWKKAAKKWENHIPSPAPVIEDIQKLQDNLILILHETLDSFYKDNEIKQFYINTMIFPINNILNAMPDNDIKYRCLKTISTFDNQKIVSNIFRENDDSLKILIENIYKYPELF